MLEQISMRTGPIRVLQLCNSFQTINQWLEDRREVCAGWFDTLCRAINDVSLSLQQVPDEFCLRPGRKGSEIRSPFCLLSMRCTEDQTYLIPNWSSNPLTQVQVTLEFRIVCVGKDHLIESLDRPWFILRCRRRLLSLLGS